ncbi:enoyl-CoA hydratase/isomerase family protein [Pseudogemmobacter sp. W21_MBD1_M6]|uniref:enoyl-CoA hydratase/isomerase family protein n=1 Tax=Pseudogemmobacter sp. W21_MBD1_M6 TaxID=3240271 RepID=UPI003F9432B9
MSDISLRKDGQIGHITLTRPQALNALTYDMCLAIEAAIDTWRTDDRVRMILFDATGDRAFCSGGDIAEIYATGTKGNDAYAQRFWRDEYRLNAKLARYPKPVAALMQGFTMGGGVGLGCHGSHRVVCETSQIAMPECTIGLIPDVGGSLLLARAPGRLGEYLGTTGTRMGPGDAIHAGFADHYIPQADWPALTETLIGTGDSTAITRAALTAPDSPLAARQTGIDAIFDLPSLADIVHAAQAGTSDLAISAAKALARNSPLAMACAVDLIRRVREAGTIEQALELEYRFTHRALKQSDFLEGIRAAIIDKDRAPKWRHTGPQAVTPDDIETMLAPLGPDTLILETPK